MNPRRRSAVTVLGNKGELAVNFGRERGPEDRTMREKMTFLKVNLPLRGSSNQVDTHTGMIAMGIILWSFLR